MKKNKKQKGFIQIPLLIAIVVSIVVILAVTTGVMLYKQGKINLGASVLEPVKEGPKTVQNPKIKPEETQIMEDQSQSEDIKQEEQQEENQSESITHFITPPSLSPEIKTEEVYQDPKEELIEELEAYISQEEQEKEQTAIRLLAEGQFGEYSGWVATSYLPLSAVEEVIRKGAYLVGESGYLGKITKNRFDSDSIFYKLGKYGSLILGDGIWPILSPNNPFNVIGEKPKIYLTDGTFFACLSIGLVSTDCDNRILNPKRLILYMYENYNIDDDYLDYIYK